MKKIYNILFVLLAGLSFTACTSEVDDVFDKSSAERIQEAIANDQKMLVDAPNGWLLEYYCESTYGGYNMFVKFNADNTVTVANEVYGHEARETSHYKLEQSQGVLLSFDEHNTLFHFFSEPANPDGIGTDGKGMQGDFEFRVLSADADKFVLKGKKHGVKMVMTRVAEDLDWTGYMDDVTAMENNFSYKKYVFVKEGSEDSLLVNTNYRTLIYHSAETDQDVTVPYVVTSEGLKFKKAIPFGDAEVSFVKPSTTEEDTWVTGNEDGIKLVAVAPSLVEMLTDETLYWSFHNGADFMSSMTQTYFKQAENGSASEGEEIVFIALGVNPNAANLGWGCFFRSGNYIGTFPMNLTTYDDTHFALNPNTNKFDGNGKYYYNVGYKYISNGFLYGSFELSADDTKNPSWIKMTRTNGNWAGHWAIVRPGLLYYAR